MLRAFVECLVLVGIHAYLGLHVIRRKVIFVDLALAQVAALGITIGFLFGMAPNSTAALLFSMLFTFVAAALFALTRTRGDRVPHEAIIGVVYAVSAAVIILVVDRAPHGAEHIKEVMTGAILWVSWQEIGLAAAVYAVVGLFHFIYRKPILAISDDPEAARASGMRMWVWDFWFYLSFGVVIAISVRTAGVLLVFVFLVVPAIIATLITARLKLQLLIGWSMGLLVTVLGLGISYFADMPAGPSVVSFYGLILGLVALVVYLWRAPSRRQAMLRAAYGLAVAVVLVGGIWSAGRGLAASPLAQSGHHQHAAHDHGNDPQVPAVAELTIEHQDCVFGDQTAGQQHHPADDHGLSKLETALQNADDDELRLSYALHIACHNPQRGARHLIDLLQKSEAPFIQAEALAALQKLAGRPFDFDPERSPQANRTGIQAIQDWWRKLPTK